MNFLAILLSGAALGYFAAIPIGPVNLICIRRTLHFGSYYGFLSGVGAALGDALFAAITAFGLTAVAQLIVGHAEPLELAGGIFLLVFGISTFFAPPPPSFEERLSAPDAGMPPLARAVVSTFMLTVSNPATLFAYTAFVAGLSGVAGGTPSFAVAAFVVLGVFCGSSLWWLTLATLVGLLHARINDRTVRHINEISGFMVATCGALILLHLAGLSFLGK